MTFRSFSIEYESMRESCKKSSSNKDPSFGLQLLLQKCKSHGEKCTKQIHVLFPSQQDKVNSSFSKCVSHQVVLFSLCI